MLDTTKIAAHAAAIAAQVADQATNLDHAQEILAAYQLTAADREWVSRTLYQTQLEAFSALDWARLQNAVWEHADAVRHGWYEIGQGLAVCFDGEKPSRLSIKSSESPSASHASVEWALGALGFSGRVSGWESGEAEGEEVAFLSGVENL